MQIEGVEEDNAELIMQAGQTGQTVGEGQTVGTDIVHPTERINSYLLGHCDITSASSVLFYKTVYQLLIDGVNGWTSGTRIQFIRGLKIFYTYTILKQCPDYSVGYDYTYIHTLISTVTSNKTYDSHENESDGTMSTPTLAEEAIVGLGIALRSDEVEIRVVAQECSVELGMCCGGNSTQHCFQLYMELLIVRISGRLAGGDTASQRK